MKAIRILITSFIDNHFPGFVECQFTDANGKLHIIHDKVPVVTDKYLDENSPYPQEGVIGCEVLESWKDKDGKTILKVNTSKPWYIDTVEGLTEFDIYVEQLVES